MFFSFGKNLSSLAACPNKPLYYLLLVIFRSNIVFLGLIFYNLIYRSVTYTSICPVIFLPGYLPVSSFFNFKFNESTRLHSIHGNFFCTPMKPNSKVKYHIVPLRIAWAISSLMSSIHGPHSFKRFSFHTDQEGYVAISSILLSALVCSCQRFEMRSETMFLDVWLTNGFDG